MSIKNMTAEERAEFMHDLREEMKQEAHQEEMYEYNMRSDWDYAIEDCNLNEESTLEELQGAKDKLNRYGWDIGFEDILECIL